MMGRFLSVKVFDLNRFDGALGELLPRQEIVRVKVGIRKKKYDERRLGTAARYLTGLRR
jgi:hypothetical protein